MGDAADLWNENGAWFHWLHLKGECGSVGPCSYCDEDALKERKMAGKVVKSGLMAKYGSKLDQAVRKHAKDETRKGFQRLPGGIKNGVAQLIECGFVETDKGEYQFRAAGTVILPDVVMDNGVPVKVKGMQTRVFEDVFPTKNNKGQEITQEEHISRILNHMRLLGGDDFTENATGADLESLAEALTEAAPFFKFETREGKPSKEYPNPLVFETWYGTEGLEDFDPQQIQDKTQAETTEDESGAEETTTPKTSNGKMPTRNKAAREPEPEPDSGIEEDLDALVEAAVNKDTKAQEKLQDMAISAGVSEGDINDAASWQEVADLIRAGGTSDTDPGDNEPEPPTKGQVWTYRPVDPKTKKPAKKAVKCEIVSVDKKTETCKLLNLENSKTTYSGVAWSDLEASD